jgi:hypothetical protein
MAVHEHTLDCSKADEVAFFQRRLREAEHALARAEQPDAARHHGRLVTRYQTVLQLYPGR